MNSSPKNQEALTILNGFFQSIAERNPEAVASTCLLMVMKQQFSGNYLPVICAEIKIQTNNNYNNL